MEELVLLRELIEKKEYQQAVEIVNELEEISREDKLGKIYSYAVILLLHLIKQDAENRSTRSWEFAIYNRSKEIKRVNKRKKSGGFYAHETELEEIFTDAFDTAIKKAALEAFEGVYTEHQLQERIDEEEIKRKAMKMILPD